MVVWCVTQPRTDGQKPFFVCRRRHRRLFTIRLWTPMVMVASFNYPKIVLLLLVLYITVAVAHLVRLAMAWMMVVVIFIYPHLMPCFFFLSPSLALTLSHTIIQFMAFAMAQPFIFPFYPHNQSFAIVHCQSQAQSNQGKFILKCNLLNK